MATLNLNDLLFGRKRQTIINGNYALAEVVKHVTALKSPRFISFIYENEFEISAVTVLVGLKLENAYKYDLAVLEEINRHETDGLRLEAMAEIMISLRESLEFGIGNNHRYTNKNTYTHVEGKNGSVKVHNDNGMAYLSGTVVRKRVLAYKAERPVVNSRPKTIAKNQIKKEYCKMSNFRQYKLNADSLTSISFAHNRIIFNAEQYNKVARLAKQKGGALTIAEYNAM